MKKKEKKNVFKLTSKRQTINYTYTYIIIYVNVFVKKLFYSSISHYIIIII